MSWDQGRRQGYAPVFTGIPKIWTRKKIRIHIRSVETQKKPISLGRYSLASHAAVICPFPSFVPLPRPRPRAAGRCRCSPDLATAAPGLTERERRGSPAPATMSGHGERRSDRKGKGKGKVNFRLLFVQIS